jgi:hypothetical protein
LDSNHADYYNIASRDNHNDCCDHIASRDDDDCRRNNDSSSIFTVVADVS